MKYTREVVIDLPRDRVIELFMDRDNMPKWQTGLKSFEHVSGEPGQAGETSRLVYEHRGQDVEMIETVTSQSLPDALAGTYETEGVWNYINNRFRGRGTGPHALDCRDGVPFLGLEDVGDVHRDAVCIHGADEEDAGRLQDVCRGRRSRGVSVLVAGVSGCGVAARHVCGRMSDCFRRLRDQRARHE